MEDWASMKSAAKYADVSVRTDHEGAVEGRLETLSPLIGNDPYPLPEWSFSGHLHLTHFAAHSKITFSHLVGVV